MNVPTDLKYTRNHEWGKLEGTRMRVGITDYAQHELGDVVYCEFSPVGTKLKQGDSFGTVESVKAVSDVYAPVSGVIVELNTALGETPEEVNRDCYGQAWMIVIEMQDPSEAEGLMDAAAYAQFVAQEGK